MEDKGLGSEAVNEKVYPVWTYSYFAFLVPVGLAGEWLGYRPIIGAEFVFLLVTYVILIWGEGLQWMQVMQVTFGFTSAAQTCVFFTYVYQCCPLELYHTAVSPALTRSHSSCSSLLLVDPTLMFPALCSVLAHR
jgi:thiamine transporter 2/3